MVFLNVKAIRVFALFLAASGAVLDCYTPFSRPRPAEGEPALIISSRRSHAEHKRLLEQVRIEHCTLIASIDNSSFFSYPDWYTSEVVLSNMVRSKGADTIVVNRYNYLTYEMGGKAFRCGASRMAGRFTPPGEEMAPVPLNRPPGGDCLLPADVTQSRAVQFCYENLEGSREKECLKETRENLCRRVNGERSPDCVRLCGKTISH